MQRACHGLLWAKAAHLFSCSDAAAARELFSAALHFAPPGARAKNARMLSACHTKLDEHQRAVEYLDIAAREEQSPTIATQLMRLQAYLNADSPSQAVGGA